MADNNTQLTPEQKIQMFDMIMARVDQKNAAPAAQPQAQNQQNVPAAQRPWTQEEIAKINAATFGTEKTFTDHAIDAAVIGGGIVIGGAGLWALAQIASAIFGSNK